MRAPVKALLLAGLCLAGAAALLHGLREGEGVVMLGDSITAGGRWPQRVAGAVDRGRSGDTTTKLLQRLDAVPREGRTVFLMIGLNDLRRGAGVEDTAARTAEIVARLAPARVYLVSTLLTRDPHLNHRIAALNALTAKDCSQRCTVLDANSLLAPEGMLKPEFTYDGFHLSEAGYRAYHRVIAPAIEAADGS